MPQETELWDRYLEKILILLCLIFAHIVILNNTEIQPSDSATIEIHQNHFTSTRPRLCRGVPIS